MHWEVRQSEKKSCSIEKTLNFAFVATNRTTYRASKCSRIHFEKVLVKCIVKSVANLIWVGC